VASVVIASLFLLCVAGAATNHIGTDKPVHLPYLVLAVGLVVVPLLPHLVLVALNRRNVFLRWVDGRLTLGEWTGRVVHVDRPQSVREFPVGTGSLLVIAGQSTQPPIVLNPGWWVEEDLGQLLSTLGLPVTGAPITALRRTYPGVRLPFSLRHPAVFVSGSLGAAVVWFFSMAFLVTHL
jgi:hypothetical protein